MFKSPGPVSNHSKRDQLNPWPGRSVTCAIQPQPSQCLSGWCIEAANQTQQRLKPMRPTQSRQGSNTPIHLLREVEEELMPMIGINRLAMIGRESTELSTVCPANKLR